MFLGGHRFDKAIKSPPFKRSLVWRPFCSERCQIIDLGAWASERYRIPVKEQDSGPEAAGGAQGGF
ncbi:MAG: DNA gyrase inhibitor YacG [Nitrospira sp.]|nr:DNA gyrase inhibitor YacG [Nitrospira sp.]